MIPDLLNLLVFEDGASDPGLLESQLQQIRPDGFAFQHATTSERGLALLEEEPFDCVFLDNLSDDRVGLQVLREIRDRGWDTPVIAASGRSDELTAVEAMKLGAQDYIVKGRATPEAVDRALQNAIEKVALERQLAEKRRDLESFVHVAAHDLKGPITTIRSFAELILLGGPNTDERETRELLERISANAERMQELVSALLDYAVVGRSKVTLKPVSLNTVVDAALENLAAEIADSRATVERANLPTVLGDTVSLTQLFQNLVANAIKFCRERDPVVSVTASPERGWWTVSVEDNGIGIAPEYFQAIFVPFRRLHNRSDYEGSGLGLATCKRIVDHHGGEIWVESEIGERTSFYLTLRDAAEAETCDRELEPCVEI